MKGLITIDVENHKVKFDFENYTYGILFSVNETKEERLRISGIIEENNDYKLLRKCLVAKHDFNLVPDSDPQKYRQALDEFTDWCMEKRSI